MFQRRLEALVAEGFQQVVHGVGLERTNGVPVVGRDEDRQRHPGW